MNASSLLDHNNIPKHVAVIMDGNGRWAQLHGQPRTYGHTKGVEAVRRVVASACQLGIEYLPPYTFSEENWNRPQQEVSTLMHLLGYSMVNELPQLQKQGIRLQAIGNLSHLPLDVQNTLQTVVKQTAHNSKLTLVLALSYSAKEEIVQACKKLAQQTNAPQEWTEKDLAQHLYTCDIPDPDLIIRTGGEYRLSNFLLWQSAYAELYFTPICWPDFNHNTLCEALCDFQQRQRRYGKTGEQVSQVQDASVNRSSTPNRSINEVPPRDSE